MWVAVDLGLLIFVVWMFDRKTREFSPASKEIMLAFLAAGANHFPLFSTPVLLCGNQI